ncbi:MAG TPA: right-handed parallel beta-helix repeat-containing protein, partial [Thermoanaerobaculia bacterium]|nr:right-handed parallel beta-helix repeat-containing protein [Thermoanaerobaculia bacterium]
MNGTIAEGEYAHSSGDWSMTWDATYLYVAKANVTSGNGLVIYLDVDPRPTPAAGTNANGNLNGQNDQWMSSITGFAPDLPFRGDARSLTGAGGIAELRTRDGSGGWTNVSTDGADVTTAVSGTNHEVRIRWGAMLGSLSAPPTSFNWLGFEIRDAAGMTEGINTRPSANPGVGNSRMPYLLTVANTGNGTSSDPFATIQSTWKVAMNNDSGAGSLREAITNAEADGTSSRRYITFGTPVGIIQLNTDLPVITKTTTIDGTSHPNWTADPVVALESSGATTGIELSAAANGVVRGLEIKSTFTNPVKVTGGSGNTIAGNWIGLSGGGNPANDVVLNGTTNCTIGGTAAADRNVIAHASGSGISITGSSGTQVLNNYIGTDNTGLNGAGNHLGVFVDNTSSGTVIGSAANGNVISSNETDGIGAQSSVTILGNKIGAAADGSPLGNGGTGVQLNASNVTIGTIAAPNVIRANNAAIVGTSGGGLSIRGNSIFAQQNAGIALGGVVQASPTISSATIDGSGLTITLSAASGGTTQSLRLDLYDADPSDLSIIQPKTYRATSQCYAGSSLSNTAWNVGSGYAPGDKLVLMITSYTDGSCTDIGDGTSEPSAVITPIAVTTTTLVSAPILYATPFQGVTLTATVSSAVAGVSGNVSFTANGNPIAGCTSVTVSSNQAQCLTSFPSFGTYTLGASYAGTATHAASAATPIQLTVARIFNGPGNFSDASLWTDSNAPLSNQPFVIKGACTFDSAAPARAYGAMTLAANATMTWTTNHTTALTVTDINGAGTNTIDMTGGGLLRFSGTYDTTDVTFTRGSGTVVLSGVSQAVPLLTYNKLTIVGTTTLTGTITVHGTLDVLLASSLTGGTITMRGPSIANAGTLTVANLTIPTGVTTTTSSSFGVTGSMTVDGTFS